MNIRRAEAKDLVRMQACNTNNLPENYPMRFWVWCLLTWPELSFLAEDERGKVVGYVLCSIERAEGSRRFWVGNINSVSILKPYRRLGLAHKMMTLSRDAMARAGVPVIYVQLNVRKSNRAAISLYRDKLGYRFHHLEPKYYGDEEDALAMRLPLHTRDSNEERSARPRTSRVPQRRTLLDRIWLFVHEKRRWLAEATPLQRRNSVQ